MINRNAPPRNDSTGTDTNERITRQKRRELFHSLNGFEDTDSRVRRYQNASTTEEQRLLRERIVKEHMGLINYLVRRFVNREETIDDLMQVGVVGLLGAIDRFDSDKGVRFVTFARPSILGELKRHFRDRTRAIRVPRSLQERSLEVIWTETALYQELGRRPTATEIGERIGAHESQVRESLKVSRTYKVLSLDRPDERDNGENATIGELCGEVDARLAKLEALVALGPAMAELSDHDKRTLYLRFYQGMTQKDIALELKVSQMQVSRNLARILSRLRAHVA